MPETNVSLKTLHSSLAEGRFANPDFGIFEAAPPAGSAVRGGIVLIQEVFGVNQHIRDLASRYAERGYVTWAPCYFDHVEKGVDLPYDADGIQQGRNFTGQLGWEQAVEDTRLAAAALKRTLPKNANQVAAIGFCWGGSVAWLAACRLNGEIDAAVSYYGRQAWDFRSEKAKVPVILHFGERDSFIPMSNVDDFKRAQPGLPVYVYEAGHGFSCDARQDYDAKASALADERSMRFLNEAFAR